MWKRRLLPPPLAVAMAMLLAGAALTTCVPDQTGSAETLAAAPDSSDSGDDGQKPSGLAAYLVGRFADAHGDTRAAATFLAIAAAADREITDLHRLAFTLLVAEGRFDEATPMAERLLQIDDEAPLPAILLGTRAAAAGQFSAAERQFDALPRKGLNAFLAPLLLAWAEAGRGDIDGALRLLKVGGTVKAFAPVFDLHAALIADLANRPDLAETHFQAALQGQRTLRAVEAAGAFYQRAGRIEAARALYQKYHEEQPDRSLFDGDRALAAGSNAPRVVVTYQAGLAEALFDAASLARQSGAQDLALVFSRLALNLRPNFPLCQLLLADVLSRQGRLEEAEPVFHAIDPNATAADYARLRLAVNLDEAGRTDAAVSELRRLVDSRPDGYDAAMTLGDVLRGHKRFAEAAEAYDVALRRATSDQKAANPQLWPLYYARGIALERSGQWPRAEADFLQALKLKPDQPDVLNYLGYSWVDQGNNLAEGRSLLERAVKQRPNDGAIIDSLGWALFRLGDYAGAVRHLERAAELKPEDPTINEHLGDALWRVGRTDEARFQWQRALTLNPEPEQIEPLKAKVSSGQLSSSPTTK